MPEAVRVELLGGFRISVGSRAVDESEWRLRKAASLVKLLALAPQHRLHREQVMDLLWSDLDPKAAANNLRYVLHKARRTLEQSAAAPSRCLHLQGDLLALSSNGPLWVDAEAFEDAAAVAHHTHNQAAYEAALELYAGDLLPMDRYEAWAEDRRQMLRRTYLALLLEMAKLHEKRGDFGLAIEAFGRVLAAEPTHEGAHVGLTRLYTLWGRQDQALRQCEQFRGTFSHDFGTEPNVPDHHFYKIPAGQFPLADPPSLGSLPEEGLGDDRYNLPAAKSSFVGRECELIKVKQALSTSRLLTLTGTCGSGKTRLALEVTKDLVGAYPDGVWLIELATLSEGLLVPWAVAEALGVREQPGRPLCATMVDVLLKKKALLVLDNCEHLIDAVVHLVDTLLASCPHLRILATSREALGVAGEVKWLVPPLSLPDSEHPPTAENLMRFESTRLFLERAQSQHPALVLTPRNVRGVVSICQQLNGLPLAIELAAARVGTLSVEKIAARLNDCLKLLTLGDRTAPPRQRTLRRALDWSYNLLSESEQKLFERLSAFLGGWTLEAAEAVAAGDGIDEGDVLDLLSRLVDKSLVLAEAAVEGALRYKMLEPARQYGLERLEARGEAGPIRRRHASWFLELAEEAEPELKGTWQEEWSERLERDRGNLRTALSWTLEREETQLALRLAGALGEFWHLRGHLSEGRQWLEAALMKTEALSVPLQAKALVQVGCIAWEQGDYERSIAFSEESLALSRKVGDTVGVAAALSNLAWAALYQNKVGRASKLAEETVTLHRASRDVAGLGRALLILGMVAAVQRDYERATVLHKKSLRLARKAKDNFAVILSLALGAFTSLGQGDYKRAGSLCAEGLEQSWQLKMKRLIAAHLHILAALAGLQGRPVRSARLWGSAEALREALGTVLSPVERCVYEPHIAAARARVDEAAWEAAWAEGRAMKIEAIANYALSEELSDPATVLVPEALSVGGQQSLLTPREREVALLVGQGLSNRQIATQLVLSEHTVATHIHKILKKLRLDSRTQIAARIAKQPLLLLGPD